MQLPPFELKIVHQPSGSGDIHLQDVEFSGLDGHPSPIGPPKIRLDSSRLKTRPKFSIFFIVICLRLKNDLGSGTRLFTLCFAKTKEFIAPGLFISAKNISRLLFCIALAVASH